MSIKQTIPGVVQIVIFTIEGDVEYEAYQALLRMDMPKCPHCSKDLKPAIEDCLVVVENPLQTTLGMTLGTFRTTCPECGQQIDLITQADLSAFPSIMKIIQRSRLMMQKVQTLGRGTPRG